MSIIKANDVLKSNRYKVMCKIGYGSFGEVWRVEDLRENMTKAMKSVVFDNETWEEDVAAKQEIRVLKALQGYPGVSKYYDDFVAKRNTCIILELLKENLDSIRQNSASKQLRNLTILKIAHDTVSILEYVHRKGFLHRDLKAGNIMFRLRTSSIVLIDFGRATQFLHEGGRRSRSGPGPIDFTTCTYAAPRLVRGEQASEIEDLHMLVYMLMGLNNRNPFKGDNDYKKNLKLKEKLEDHPRRFLKKSEKFLLPICRTIFDQNYKEVPDYDEIRNTIVECNQEVLPRTPFDYFMMDNGSIMII